MVISSAETKGPASAAVARKLAQKRIYQEIGAVVDKCLEEAKAGSLGHAKFLVEWAQLMGPGAEVSAKPGERAQRKARAKECGESQRNPRGRVAGGTLPGKAGGVGRCRR